MDGIGKCSFKRRISLQTERRNSSNLLPWWAVEIGPMEKTHETPEVTCVVLKHNLPMGVVGDTL